MPFELEQQLRALDALERQTDTWESSERELLSKMRQLSDGLQKEAWQRALQALQEQPEAREQLRALASDPVVYAVWRRFGLLKPSLDERIEQALLPVRPSLHAHGGDVEILEIVLPDTVRLRLTGSCEGCPASAITLAAGVVRAIRSACPEIKKVVDVSSEAASNMPDDTVSPFSAENE